MILKYLFIVFVLIVGIAGSWQSSLSVLASNYGKEQTGIIKLVPELCVKNGNNINVQYDEHVYLIRISQIDCQKGIYRVGEELKIKIYKNTGIVVNAKPTIFSTIFFIVLTMAGLFYGLKMKINR